ncbi:MAG: outer membrane protein assembly factor BamD, partial [Acidobacteria bacterium]
MSRRISAVILLGALLFCAACTNKKVNNPLANVGSKQPDKVLFDRAMDAMKHNRFDVARMTLQTLINTYPDSEFIARAKLAVGDSWYAEGGTAALAQAEIEYKDFETFFPNMPEAAEAQLKIANIHYQEMEKPDRDYTHAKRAEDEYRALILQYPDSKLVPEAKQRLMEVQEVLGEREFEIGRFYFLRQSYPAAIARLASLVERYPLYSGADEALYTLGQSYEGEVTILRSKPFNETQKAQAIEAYTRRAADAYSKILTRYPVMNRAEDAKKRLEALHRPVPTATQAAIAQNKAEEDSRHTTGMVTHVIRGFQKHPDVARASKVGEPPLVDP